MYQCNYLELELETCRIAFWIILEREGRFSTAGTGTVAKTTTTTVTATRETSLARNGQTASGSALSAVFGAWLDATDWLGSGRSAVCVWCAPCRRRPVYDSARRTGYGGGVGVDGTAPPTGLLREPRYVRHETSGLFFTIIIIIINSAINLLPSYYLRSTRNIIIIVRPEFHPKLK